MRYLIDIDDLTPNDIDTIWRLTTDRTLPKLEGTVAWSFEGNGIRTRTTFIRAFQELGLSYIELPNFLKTSERVEDLAGYVDPFYRICVLRDSNHARMTAFADASSRPVINAMTSMAHPCEVLTDAYCIDRDVKPIRSAAIMLWGPLTNVLRSWYSLAKVLDFEVLHYCPPEFRIEHANVVYIDEPTVAADVVITDGWPAGFADQAYSLTEDALIRMGKPQILPTPPFTISKEIAFDPVQSAHFMGYAQKELLLDVQRAILLHALCS